MSFGSSALDNFKKIHEQEKQTPLIKKKEKMAKRMKGPIKRDWNKLLKSDWGQKHLNAWKR